jgi:hypothetical protein
MMRSYNLFRRADREALVCAVPEDSPVPAFIRGTSWEFGGRLEGTTIGSSQFDREAADISVRYNGFYLFQLVRASDLPLSLDRGCPRGTRDAAPARNQDAPRGVSMGPDRLPARVNQNGDFRPAHTRVPERLSHGV